MERLKASSFVWVWSILGLLCMVTIWFLPWRFQTNDDVIMMWLVSGAYTGEPETYAVFIHPLLSWFFSKLYSLFPSISWYALTWFSVVFLSYQGLIISLNRTKIGIYWVNIVAIFCLFHFLHFCLFLQFTIVAGVAAFSGLILLEIWNREKSKAIFILSVGLITVSILIRSESFVLILFGFSFYFLTFKITKIIPRFSKSLIPPVVLFVVLIAGRIIWEKQSDYAGFVEYNKARAAVSDHPVSYKLIAEEKLNRESKWFFFNHWFMDADSISIEELEQKKSELDEQYFSRDQFSNSFTRLISVMRAEAFKSMFSFILLIFYFYRFKGSKKSLIFLGIWILFFLLFNHFFILNGRVVILFFLPFLFPLVLEPVSVFVGERVFVVTSAFILFCFGYHLVNFFKEAKGREIMKEEFMTLTGNLPEKTLIVLEGYKENYLGITYTTENPVPFLSFGWISKSPFQQKKLQKLGLSQIIETNEYYLLGVDVNQEFFFPDYIGYLIGDFHLESKTRRENFILFHYIKSY